MITKIFGPPGTGKTTFLLNKVEEYLDRGIQPEQIGYFAFTRKAANEAKTRALKRFSSLSEKQFDNFRTLHSLAYSRLGIQSSRMVSSSQLKEFAEDVGLSLFINKGDESWDLKASNPVLDVINLSRLKLTDLKKEYNRSNLEIGWQHFIYVYKRYKNYLEKNNLLDFTNLLEDFSTAPEDYYPNFHAIIVDEAQDLSALQWKVVDRLVKKSKEVFIAGDDDQAIFSFAGADVKTLLTYPGNHVVLNQSHRIPEAVHKYANQIVKRIKYRVPKNWDCRSEKGSINKFYDYKCVDFNQGNWLILAPTNYLLNDVHSHLKTLGILFERNNVRSISGKITDAVDSWEKLRKKEEISADSVKNVYAHLGKSFVKRGYKKFNGDSDLMYDIEVLKNNYGLEFKDVPWHESLSKLSDEQSIYIRSAVRRGQSLTGTPSVKLSTIHGAKGGEADNVMLFPDLSEKFLKEYHKNPDDINRLFYVGITRTRKNLNIVYPRQEHRSFYL